MAAQCTRARPTHSAKAARTPTGGPPLALRAWLRILNSARSATPPPPLRARAGPAPTRAPLTSPRAPRQPITRHTLAPPVAGERGACMGGAQWGSKWAAGRARGRIAIGPTKRPRRGQKWSAPRAFELAWRQKIGAPSSSTLLLGAAGWGPLAAGGAFPQIGRYHNTAAGDYNHHRGNRHHHMATLPRLHCAPSLLSSPLVHCKWRQCNRSCGTAASLEL